MAVRFVFCLRIVMPALRSLSSMAAHFVFLLSLCLYWFNVGSCVLMYGAVFLCLKLFCNVLSCVLMFGAVF